jgi:hypothetical protein
MFASESLECDAQRESRHRSAWEQKNCPTVINGTKTMTISRCISRVFPNEERQTTHGGTIPQQQRCRTKLRHRDETQSYRRVSSSSRSLRSSPAWSTPGISAMFTLRARVYFTF